MNTNNFEKFAFSVNNYILNDRSDQLKKGIELIKQNINLSNNAMIKGRILSVKRDFENMFIYYDNIVKILFKINNWSQTTDYKTDLSVVQSDITTLCVFLNNESVDEVIRLTWEKIYEIGIVINDQKNKIKDTEDSSKETELNLNRNKKRKRTETNEASTST